MWHLGYLVSWCLIFLTVLSHILVLQRFCIIYLYFNVLLLHFTSPIVIFVWLYVCLTWPFYICILLLVPLLPEEIIFQIYVEAFNCHHGLCQLWIWSLLFCLLLVSNFVMMLDLVELKFQMCIYCNYVSIISSKFYQFSFVFCYTSYMGLLLCIWGLSAFNVLQCTFLKWLSLQQLLHVFQYAQHCLRGGSFHSFYIFVLCLKGSGLVQLTFLCLFWFFLYFMIISKSLASFKLSSIAFCDHCASILLAQDRTCSYVTSLVS